MDISNPIHHLPQGNVRPSSKSYNFLHQFRVRDRWKARHVDIPVFLIDVCWSFYLCSSTPTWASLPSIDKRRNQVHMASCNHHMKSYKYSLHRVFMMFERIGVFWYLLLWTKPSPLLLAPTSFNALLISTIFVILPHWKKLWLLHDLIVFSFDIFLKIF